ncbi:hypothetical protein ACJX0J_011838, partial [Zea mays]
MTHTANNVEHPNLIVGGTLLTWGQQQIFSRTLVTEDLLLELHKKASFLKVATDTEKRGDKDSKTLGGNMYHYNFDDQSNFHLPTGQVKYVRIYL